MRRTRRGASPPRRSGDDVGPQGIPAPAILDTTTQRFRFYLIALGLLVAFYLLYRRFVDSPTGRVCAVEFLAWLREEDIPLAGARQGDLELARHRNLHPPPDRTLPGLDGRNPHRAQALAAGYGAWHRPTDHPRGTRRAHHPAIPRRQRRPRHPCRRLVLVALRPTCRPHRPPPRRRRETPPRGLVTVAFGHEPAPLPCPLDRLTSEQLHRADATGSLWLLPGHVPGHHITTNALTSKLRDVGIVIRAGKNSALDALVSELPAALAADATGYSPTTTVRHSAAAGVPWAAYPGRRRP